MTYVSTRRYMYGTHELLVEGIALGPSRLSSVLGSSVLGSISMAYRGRSWPAVEVLRAYNRARADSAGGRRARASRGRRAGGRRASRTDLSLLTGCAVRLPVPHCAAHPAMPPAWRAAVWHRTNITSRSTHFLVLY